MIHWIICKYIKVNIKDIDSFVKNQYDLIYQKNKEIENIFLNVKDSSIDKYNSEFM
jgi:hypothetical protein